MDKIIHSLEESTIRRARGLLVGGVSAIALTLGATAAAAQDSGAQAADDRNAQLDAAAAVGEDDEIVVTGSRLRTDGMKTPVPVIAIKAEELTEMAPSNLIEGISELPQFYNNQTPASTAAWFTRGGYGNLDLRGLGINRTLTLLNGRRMISSSAFGGVDINVFPEAMISSVETVTGGASAAYGTDAVAGVVNFILDTKFTGLEASAQGGVTSRGDGESWEGSVSWGTRIGERGHFLISGEIFDQNGIHNFEDRNWYQAWGMIQGPDNIVRAFPNVVSATATFDGVISRPGSVINGLQFDRDGNLSPFVLGSPSQGAIGAPGARHSIADGGSGEDLAAEVQTVFPDFKRNSIFAYADYELADGFTVFAQYMRGQNKTFRYNTPRGSLQGQPTAITIFQDNAFLPDSLRQTMIDNAIPSFTLRRMGSIEDIGQMWLKDNNIMNSGTVGFTWELESGGFMQGWNIDAYYQHGRNKRIWRQYGLRVDRIFAAVDAVRDPGGNIVCRTTLFSDVFAGCEPLNLFGRGNASEAAVDWVVGSEPGEEISSPIFYADSGYDRGESHSFTTEDAKVNRTNMRQHLAEISFTGDIVEAWAGPISAAFGASWRQEKIKQIVEDVTNPASDHSTFRPVRCNDPAIGLRGVSPPDCANTVGIQFSKVSNIRGTIDVPEAFAEVLVPLLADMGPIRSANLHGAVRWADYTGSGSIWAYKGGLDLNVADIVRLRGTYSRDVRAANLSERFDKTGGAATINDPRYPALGPYSITIFSGGNPNVAPERADTWTAGVVLRPPFIPGLSVSVDWYKIDIKDAISQLGTQLIINQCEGGAPEACALVTRDVVTDRIILVGNIFVNVAQSGVKGIDVEATYNRDISLFGGGPEAIAARLFASFLDENSQTNSLGVTIDRAGQTGIQFSDGVAWSLPDFKATGNLTYSNGGFTAFFQGRYIGDGTIENAPIPNNVTLEHNHVDSAFYLDASLSYEFQLGGGNTVEVFGNVSNLLDKDPPVTPYYSAFLAYSQQYNPSLFDVLGRRYTLGVRVRM
jgi:iron complex outermembrane recepter protein